MKTFVIFIVTLFRIFIHCQRNKNNIEYLTQILYENRNVSIYASISNHGSDPKTWSFFYDPLVILSINDEKWLSQLDNDIRITIHFSNGDLDHLTRTTIAPLLHSDVSQFAINWLIEPLPIDILTAYIVDEFNQPLPGVLPCYQAYVTKTLVPFTCRFECSSTAVAVNLVEKILCGKYSSKFLFQLNVPVIRNRISNVQLKNLVSFATKNRRQQQFIHLSQMSKFVAEYFIAVQQLDDKISEEQLLQLFQQGMDTTTRLTLDISSTKDIWMSEDIQSLQQIINNDLFYKSRSQQDVLFHVRSHPNDNPYFAIKTVRQTLAVNEIVSIFEKKDLDIEWTNGQWVVHTIYVHRLQDIVDVLHLSVINNLFREDEINSTFINVVNCISWAKKCVCQSNRPAMVFNRDDGTQRAVIPTVNLNFRNTNDLTIEVRVRPDLIPVKETHIFDLRGLFTISYLSNGKISFTVGEASNSLSVFTPQPIELGKWTHVAGVFDTLHSSVNLFINSLLVSTVSFLNSPLLSNFNMGSLVLGNSYKLSVQQGFIGAMCDVRLWNCIRTSNEIFSTMNLTLIGNETCLIGLWPLMDGKGQIIQDLTRYGNAGTLGRDVNPDLDDPTWAVVNLPPAVPKRTITPRPFRYNLSIPVIVQWGLPYDLPVGGDYDGDGFGDFAIWRPTTLTWYIVPSTNPLIILTRTWGLPGDTPVAGDYDGDGRFDHAVWRNGTWYINPSSNPSVQWTKQFGLSGDKPVPKADFDGDGRSDFCVWTPSSGIFTWIPSSNPSLILKRPWGLNGDIPRATDYDGDKHTDFVVYRPVSGTWFIIPYSGSSVLITQRWGYSFDLPVAGDFDGDLKSDYALWRPRNGSYLWEIIPSITPVAILRKRWGFAGDVPVVGDFDGDKRADFTVWRPSDGFWYILLSDSPGIQISKKWGSLNDTAVAGDWDGDGLTDYTIYRPSTGFWHIMLNKNPLIQIVFQWGVAAYGDIPVPGDFDGDSKSDFAVWRPSTGIWYILLSSNPAKIIMTQWGLPNDIPVTGVDFDADGKTDIAVYRPSTGFWYVIPSSNPSFRFGPPLGIIRPLKSLPPAAASETPVAAAVAADKAQAGQPIPSPEDNANKG
ncbi:unnamed protein product [Didymodactylos carnosus]|uniref:LamG-like jellyroll fold domain-containing protein n=1 Tax=Didymodactylos carnosus TaxID=1234261 RepID=A0A8S2DD25_9BILA|nr:unnamed protein product [Didymodactylos carnosus]CAF3673265.1 unnamed protein product [Didymodactylos carnosus]